jgi:RNA polymerase sigma-70 factor (ECF subfamily)
MTNDATDWPLAATGDHDAFARIFDRHADLVFKFARRRVGDRTIAEDITSQVFLETWRRREDVTLLDGSLRAWLVGVARNLQRRHWRTNERRNRAIDRMATPVDTSDPSEAIVDHLGAIDDLASVRKKFDLLSEAHREVLLLAVWEELSYDEIAAVLDVPVGTVRSRLARARQKLDDLGTHSADRASTRRSCNSSNDGPDSPHIERTLR